MNIPIHLRNMPWPAEIFDHPEFIESIAKWYRPNIFIEYGTGIGVVTQKVAPHCKRFIGVDLNRTIVETMGIKNLEFHQMTTREFKSKVLDNITETIDMAFIDADHDSKVAFQDFEDLFPKMTENGMIFLHDTYPCEEKWTSPTFCHDSWKVPNKIKRKYGHLCDVLTIPIQPGLTIVRKQTMPLAHMNEV